MEKMEVFKAPVSCTPEEAGYAGENLDKIETHLERLIADKKITAASYLLSRNDRIFACRSMGRLRFDKAESRYKPDTIRSIASVTKIFTSAAIVRLIEDGLIYLHQPVREIIDEFDNPMFGGISIFHLLTHSGGIRPDPGCMFEPYPRKHEWFESENWIMEALRDNIHYKPGTEWRYASVGFCILAEIVSRMADTPFEQYVMEQIVRPLGMEDTYFDVPAEKEERICFANKGEFDWFQFSKKRPAWSAPGGGGGLYSTLKDMQKIGQMLINKGTYRGKRILSRKAVESMVREQFRGKNFTWVSAGTDMEYGLGFNVYSNNTFLSPGSFSHEGAGLCGLYMDPVENVVFVYFCPLAEDVGWEIKAVINFRNIVWAGIL
ncbi:MAG: beta-lactamase family protein [Spirochaetales bacterium]|nr:beta-lactamase family protein [Spirochaetales bacterium]